MAEMSSRPFLRTSVFVALLSACGDPTGGENTDEALLALDVCGEAVPANRAVDGIPAYAQCDATMDSSIWSNNGVDTSLTSLGPDWVQTQRGGGYQCTELAYRYMRFRWNVSYRSGDAQEWCDGNLPANLVKSTTPVHGDLIVFAGGVCGSAESTGHIAVVDTVDNARGAVTIVEENRAGRRSTQQSCATCFLHATANDGSIGGAAGAAGMTGMGGTSPMAGSGGVGVGGSQSNGGGSGGRSEPGNGGTAGMTAGAPGTGGSFATGGSAGTGSLAGGAPSAGMPGSAGSGPVGPGGAGNAGSPAVADAGASGTATGPVIPDDAVEGGCSVSNPHRRRRGALDHVVPLGIALGWIRWRRAKTRRRA